MKKNSVRNAPKRWLTCFFTALRPDKSKVLLPIVVALMALPLNVFGQTRLTLSDAIRLSQEHSYGVKAARSDSLSAIFDLGAARAGRFPTLSLSAMGSHINKLQSISLPFVGTQTLGVKDRYQADFRLSLPLYTGGRISNQIRIQQELSNGKSFALQSKRLDNAYITRKAYLNLMVSYRILKAAGSSEDRLQIVRNDVQNLFDAGMADSLDILESEIALEKAKQTIDEKFTAVINASTVLARLTDIYLVDEDRLYPDDSVPVPEFDIYKKVILTIHEINRPELQAIISRAHVATLAIGLNKTNYFPILSGFGGYSYGKPNLDQFNNTWNDYWTAGLNLNWNFNLGGQSIYNVRSAKEAANSANSAKSELEESLWVGAKTALENLNYAYKSFATSQRQYDLSQREFHLAENQERAGKISTNRLLELEANLTATEQMYQVSLINYYISETEYLYATGSPKIFGGF